MQHNISELSTTSISSSNCLPSHIKNTTLAYMWQPWCFALVCDYTTPSLIAWLWNSKTIRIKNRKFYWKLLHIVCYLENMNGPPSSADHHFWKRKRQKITFYHYLIQKNMSWKATMSPELTSRVMVQLSVYILHRLLLCRFWLFICKLKPKPKDILSVNGLIS